MKKVQIDYELFRKLIFYHLGSDDQYEEDIRNGLEDKLDRYNCCTKPASDPAYVAENILNREFKSDMINQKWVTDVSEFKYGVGEDDKKGKLYLSVILDLCDRRPVAFVYSTRNDNPLVFDTFDKAVAANPGATPLLHSDRGY